MTELLLLLFSFYFQLTKTVIFYKWKNYITGKSLSQILIQVNLRENNWVRK